MTTNEHAVDRRARQKERYRTAIIDATAELIRERRTTRFSVDDLAARADVSRRTVFNHFTSLDDAIATACTRELLTTISDLEAHVQSAAFPGNTPGVLFDELAATLRAADIAPAVSFIAQALANLDSGPAYPRRMVDEAFSRVSTPIIEAAVVRHTGIDRLDIELLVSTVLHAISFVSRRWVEETAATLDTASLARWDQLMDHVLGTLRDGFHT